MSKKKRHIPLLWIPLLSATEEISCAVVMYVALLMFMQFGAGIVYSSLYCGLLWLPWGVKSFLRSKVRKQGYFKRQIHIVECLMFLNLAGIAFYMNGWVVKHLVLFILMMLLSILCAWHDILSRMYYNRMLYPAQQRLYNRVKAISSQTTIVLAYGVLIIMVGFFEVFYRSYTKAWAMESSLIAAVFLLFFLVNFFVLKNPRLHNPYRYESLLVAFKNEMHVIERIRKKPRVASVITSLFFLLLPQALMFNGRVLFLLASVKEGGMDCTIQEIGFAQGAVGVCAFSLGMAMGRSLVHRYGMSRMFSIMSFVLTLSPLFYMLMSQNPLVDNLDAICCMTFFAQLLFGFGINSCLAYVDYISDHRYRNTTNILSIPLVSFAMMLPMCATGLLVSLLGFKYFFILNFACAPLAWIVVMCLKTKKTLINSNI